MDPVTISLLTAAVTAGTAGYSAYQQQQTGKKNEKLEMAETNEQARRLEDQQKDNLKRGRAYAASSGTRPGTGSQQTFLSNVGKQQEKELAWLRYAGVSRAGMQGDRATAGAVTTFGQGLASAGQSYGDWWSSRSKDVAWTTKSA